MGHTPYGYKIENGKAVIDETAAEKLRKLFDNYLNGMSLKIRLFLGFLNVRQN